MFLLVPKIIGLLKHGGICPQKQCCQLSRIIQETPDFGPYLPVSRLEYEILLKIAEFCHFLESRLSNNKISNILRCLSYFCTVNIESFLVIFGMPLYYKQACGWWEVNRCCATTNFCAFSVIANSGRSASTVSLAQITSCAICYDVIYHPFAIHSQYLKTWGRGLTALQKSLERE